MAQVDIDRGRSSTSASNAFSVRTSATSSGTTRRTSPGTRDRVFFVRLAELEMHPLDTLDRRNYIREDMGIGLCNITKCCTEVCPEDIHITDNAIIPLKERIVDATTTRSRGSGRKITGRPVPLAAAEARKHTGAAHAQPAAPATPEPGDIA